MKYFKFRFLSLHDQMKKVNNVLFCAKTKEYRNKLVARLKRDEKAK